MYVCLHVCVHVCVFVSVCLYLDVYIFSSRLPDHLKGGDIQRRNQIPLLRYLV